MDKDILGRVEHSRPKGCLQADSIIKRCIDPAVADRDIACAIDIHAITVCIDDHILDKKVRAAFGDYSEVPGFPHIEATEDDVPGIDDGNGLRSILPGRLAAFVKEEMIPLILEGIHIIWRVPDSVVSRLCPELRICCITP